jgi:hypothetical protein
MQDSVLCKLKTLATTQTTLLEDCFLAVDNILGWVDNVLEMLIQNWKISLHNSLTQPPFTRTPKWTWKAQSLHYH